MKINFDLLYPDAEIPEGDSFRCVAELVIHRSDLREVLECFEAEGIPWSSGVTAMNGTALSEPENREWFLIDCWIGRNGRRDITYAASVVYPPFSEDPGKYPIRFTLDEVMCSENPVEVLDLTTIYI